MKTSLKIFLSIFIPGIAFFNCNSQNKEQCTQAKITQIWSTPAELKTPESVKYDSINQVLFVSNVNGNPLEKDGNGFISKLSLDGKILELNWVSGLNAPKGMGIVNKTLFVTDIDRVVAIDIDNSKLKKIYNVIGAKFLNDITVGKDGTVYISDMGDNAIYVIEPATDTINLWLKSEKLTHPNGLWATHEELLAGLNDRVVSINYQSKEITDFVLNTGSIDGLVYAGNEKYLISDWTGSTHLIQKGQEVIKITDTSVEKINAADIEYIQDKNLMLVPTFFDNRVVAYLIGF